MATASNPLVVQFPCEACDGLPEPHGPVAIAHTVHGIVVAAAGRVGPRDPAGRTSAIAKRHKDDPTRIFPPVEIDGLESLGGWPTIDYLFGGLTADLGLEPGHRRQWRLLEAPGPSQCPRGHHLALGPLDPVSLLTAARKAAALGLSTVPLPTTRHQAPSIARSF